MPLNNLTELTNKINEFLWNGPSLILLLLSGIILSFKFNFFQIRKFIQIIKTTLISKSKKDVSHNSISQSQALWATLASTIGIGNIAGVSYAIYQGGPGAVFWMWIAAILSMMNSFAENILGIHFRKKDKYGKWLGGPMYTIKYGLGKIKFISVFAPLLSALFCVFCILSSFGIGNLNQINKMTENILYIIYKNNITNPNSLVAVKIFISIILVLICGYLILRGLKIIAQISEKIIPFMIIFFLIGCFIVIFYYRANLIPSVKLIFTDAFNLNSIKGGCFGTILSKIITGCKRGVFSNEAGLGSSVLINCQSETKDPVSQGMIGIVQVFTDTIVVCTISALVILTSNVYQFDTTGNGVTLAFSNVFGFKGAIFVAICIFLFAVTSVVSWSQYGLICIKYFSIPYGELIYKLFFISLIPFGVFLSPGLVWNLCDIFNALMIFPNMLSVIILYPTIKKIINNYEKKV